MTDQADNEGVFKAILTPHRSLSGRGFFLVMLFVAVVCAGWGLYFASLGAWPILGFFGLDVLIIYVAFRMNYRDGRAYEAVDVTPEALTLTRVAPSGRKDRFTFQTYWVRVLLSEWPDGRTVLRLASHGEELVFGTFLTDDERKDFAVALRDALQKARNPNLSGPLSADGFA
ncbi:MAG: DUF2244 domain-containing protein [Pseudomonadota bacterium]